MDYNREELAASRNPFAFIARAHLAARETGNDLNRRYDLRMVLHDAVESSGLEEREVLLVTRFLEDVMRLPADLDQKLFFERQTRREGKTMEYTTYAERIGERRGIKKGLKKGKIEGKIEGKAESKRESIVKLLEMRFKKVSKRVQNRLALTNDLATLNKLFTAAFNCASLKEFESLLPSDKGK